MRQFSILLLLISLPFIAMEPNNLSKRISKRLVFKRWHTQQKTIFPIPIEATLDENYIEVRFIENVDNQVIFQVKDQYGNVMWQDTTIPNEEEIYKIDLNGIEVGQYELLYIENDLTLIGEFEIENSIP
ncbi:DUF3244 domain-containing protein [Bacteroides congonensis]